MPADEQLETLSEVGVAGLLLGQRRHLERMVDHERGLDELLLGHGLEDLGDELAFAPRAVRMPAVLLEDGRQLVARACEAHVLARARARQLDHRLARPLARQVHLLALVGDLQRAACSHRRRLDVALGELHHALEVGERLIGLHRGELGVVVGIHALVAELAADLEHLLEPAHQKALERQFRGDAQVVVAVERVEVRDEGLRVRAAQDGMQKRSLNLVEALLLHVTANGRHDLEALLEHLLDLGIHHQVHVALAVARLLVGQAVELLRQRAQALAQKLERRHGNGQLPALRAHHGAAHADPVAHVEILQLAISLLAQRVDAAEQLHVARRVAQLEKRQLALVALGHDAARHLHLVFSGRAVLEIGVALV